MMEIVLLLLLLLVGIFLSAFFSGSETGFYRATRIRFVLDALSGNLVARGLHWLSNNPAMFVATTLIGNNLANYATSAAIVLVTGRLARGQDIAELVATVAMSPVVFVYGELLPKYLFFHAPNTLLRRAGGLFLCFTLLFLPIAALLWSLGRLLEGLLGQTPLRLRLTLARQELKEAMQEGREAGVLRPVQHDLAQNLFAVASLEAAQFSQPIVRETVVTLGGAKSAAMRLARRHRSNVLLVKSPDNGSLLGYVRVIDLYLQEDEQVTQVRPLLRVRKNESHVAALIRMRTSGELLASVTNDKGDVVGIVTIERLTRPLVQGE
jgi:CBS domain containing-hemolysin-like protein